MIARRALLALAVVVAALLAVPRSALAVNATATYCITYNSLLYSDNAGNEFTGSSWAAWGVKVRFTGGGQNFDHTMGTNGCKSVTLGLNAAPFVVKVLREASVTGNTLQVRNASGSLLTDTIFTNHYPLNGATYNINTTGDAAHVLAAASYALASDDLGLDVDIDIKLADCDGVVGMNCDRVSLDGNICIADLHRLYKFVVVHELGHALADAKNGGLDDAANDAASLDGCTPAYQVGAYKQNSKEFQSKAAVEGIADNDAAITFNTNSTNAACDFQEISGIDWNADGIVDPDIGEVATFSCSGGVVLDNEPDVPAYDYLGWKCLALGSSNNRATEYDWLRHLWSLDTDYGQTPTTIFEIWNQANPHNWTTSGAGTGGSYPAQRMSDAAYAVGGSALRTQYDLCADLNGTDR